MSAQIFDLDGTSASIDSLPRFGCGPAAEVQGYALLRFKRGEVLDD